MTTVANRMQVNAAIEKLIDNYDEESAKIIIKFGDTISKQARFSGSVVVPNKDRTSITGHTAEQGNVSIDTDKKEKYKQWTWGESKERIGHYRFYKVFDGRIEFHHFWASDETTWVDKEDAPTVYTLGYDVETLTPVFFGRWGKRVIFRIPWIINIIKENVDLLWGTAPDKKNVQYSISILRDS